MQPLKAKCRSAHFNNSGRRTRAGQHRTANDISNDCESRGPLMECMKILNNLAKDLHDEAKCIRTEISEMADSFNDSGNEHADTKHQLLELSKYVRILEYRLKQVIS